MARQPTPEQIERIEQVRVELVRLRRELGEEPGENRALERAASWLLDVVRPLTPEEAEKWEGDKESWLDEPTLHDLEATMTAEDKREAIDYLRDEE